MQYDMPVAKLDNVRYFRRNEDGQARGIRGEIGDLGGGGGLVQCKTGISMGLAGAIIKCYQACALEVMVEIQGSGVQASRD